MPGFIAKKLCPNLVIVPVNCEKYRAVSKDIRAILSEYDSGMCSVSLDEAYLDITEHVERRLVLTPEQRTYSRTLATNEVCCCHGNSHGSIISNGQLNIQHGNAKICENPSILSNTGNDPTLLDDVYDDNDEDVCVSWRVPDCLLCGRKTQPVECITFGFSVEEAVREMRFRIHSKTLLTASAGMYGCETNYKNKTLHDYWGYNFDIDFFKCTYKYKLIVSRYFKMKSESDGAYLCI